MPGPETIPPEGLKIVLVLFLSFLIGLEREGRAAPDAQVRFGGVRTFPLIGLLGYAMALLAGVQVWLIGLGFLGVAAFLLLSYWHQLASAQATGVTSEMSALATYLIGALVSHEQYWIATTIAVACMILLELKTALEGLAKRISADDIFAFTKFLLLTAVILPIVPNRAYTPFDLNPYQTWIVVVAVSAISYGSYVVHKLSRGRGGVLLSALLGGAYSSTLTTIVLARWARTDGRPRMLVGAMLMASGMMYLRLSVLLALFNRVLMRQLAPTFVALAGMAVLGGFFWARRDLGSGSGAGEQHEPTNPLEISAALMFALLFVIMLVAGHLAATYLGRSGVYGLAALMGVTDVDPFILSMTQLGPPSPMAALAAAAVVIAAASNNLAKGAYACAIAPPTVGRPALALLAGLAVAGLVPLLFL